MLVGFFAGSASRRDGRRVGWADRCKQLQGHDRGHGGAVGSARTRWKGDDKEGTNDDGAPFRWETYDIGFYARNNARAPAVRAVGPRCRKRLLSRPFEGRYFSQFRGTESGLEDLQLVSAQFIVAGPTSPLFSPGRRIWGMELHREPARQRIIVGRLFCVRVIRAG